MTHVDVPRWRREFPILEQSVYLLNNAFGATPRGVRTMLDRYVDEASNLGDGAWSTWYPWTLAAADRVADLIGAPAGTVTLDSSVTTFQHRMASCLDFGSARRRVVMSSLGFPSVGYAWELWSRYGAERVVVEGDGITVPTERLLEAIDETTAAVVVSLATYSSGALVDVRAIAERAGEVDALVIVDAFQAFGVVPIDVLALGVDVLISGTRKFALGSGESAFMYVRRERIEQLSPMLVGWFAHEDPLAFASEFVPARGITRFQMGTPLVLPHYVASVGWEILAAVGIEAIRERSLHLTDRIIDRADALDLHVATPRDHEQRAAVVCLRFDGADAVTERLNADGYRCSYRPASGVRVAPHFYNTEDEIDLFMEALGDARAANA